MTNYYAKLNENQICVGIISTKKNYEGIIGYIKIPDYNESLIYKKWLGDQWSGESYEPDLETKLQDELKDLREQVINMGKASEYIKTDIEMSNAMMSMEILNAITGLESKLDSFINKPEEEKEESETDTPEETEVVEEE